ncbi:solute carrier family 35 member E3 [Fusarium pseudocircinatum]|uniref:Solute carrier family 35 member E3 n=1 Tax=Fusarium pseudocircinatum TaxID=56676 RepID=A0A8H5KYG5_9HYPO|nr:solute carrier family 35 member E3 [Fusarium pseudocircinatum]
MSPKAESKLYLIPEEASSSSSTTTIDSSPQTSNVDDHDFGRRPSDFELSDLFHDDEPLLSEHEHVREKEQEQPAPRASSSAMKSTFWTLVNVVATVLIVFTNKAILSGNSLKHAQLSFAAFHFTITGLVLFILSRPRFAFFSPKSVAVRQMIPLSTVMALNVIFPNLSLAYSSVPFYQISRILITPCVAAMNFVLYRATLPFYACMALVPACVGVGMVSYFDTKATSANAATTGLLGVVFAFLGIFFSSLYTVWLESYRRQLSMTSMQLLLNQAPLSAFLLLYFIPFVDKAPAQEDLSLDLWVLILMSGIFAALVNISQFFIIAEMGPVTSTVVAHGKTCIIVAIGWYISGRDVADKSIIGLLMALLGIILYSVALLRQGHRPYRFDDEDKRYPKASHRRLSLGDALQVVSDAREGDEYQAGETYWNKHVHTPLINIIFRGTNPCPTQLDGFTSCTTASILPEYKINATVGKKVDYASFINPGQDKLLPSATKLIDKICASATDNSINHSSFQRLLDRPISFGIETKRGAQAVQKAEFQMGV